MLAMAALQSSATVWSCTRVDHRRVEAVVTEQLLTRDHAAARIEQLGGAGMAQAMRRFLDSRPLSREPDAAVDQAFSDGLVTIQEEMAVRPLAPQCQIADEGLDCDVGQVYFGVLVPLS
jgi:hypothetical protein